MRATRAGPCGCVHPGREGVHQRARPLRGVGSRCWRDTVSSPGVAEELQGTPVREARHEQSTDLRDRGVHVEAAGQGHRGLGQQHGALGGGVVVLELRGAAYGTGEGPGERVEEPVLVRREEVRGEGDGQEPVRRAVAVEGEEVQAAVGGVVAGQVGEGSHDLLDRPVVHVPALAHRDRAGQVAGERDLLVVVRPVPGPPVPREGPQHAVGVQGEHHGRRGAQGAHRVADEALRHVLDRAGAGELHGQRVEHSLRKGRRADEAFATGGVGPGGQQGQAADEHAGGEADGPVALAEVVVPDAGRDRGHDGQAGDARRTTQVGVDRGQHGRAGVGAVDLAPEHDVDGDHAPRASARRRPRTGHRARRALGWVRPRCPSDLRGAVGSARSWAPHW